MYSTSKLYEIKPDGFSPKVEIAAIYVQVDGKLLFLQRISQKSEHGAWAVPAGKLEKHETPIDAAIRELFEETGIAVTTDSLRSLGSLYIRKPDLDYVYHFFDLPLRAIPKITLSQEHSAYMWLSKDGVMIMPLMDGAKEALEVYYQRRA